MPMISTDLSPMNGWNMPMAFEPPPTQAMTASGRLPDCVEHLRARFLADHGLQLAHQVGIRMRAHRRTDDVEGVVRIADPVAERLVDGGAQRLVAVGHRHHGGA